MFHLATGVLQSASLRIWEEWTDGGRWVGWRLHNVPALLAGYREQLKGVVTILSVTFLWFTACASGYPAPVKQSQGNQLGFFPWQANVRLSPFQLQSTMPWSVPLLSWGVQWGTAQVTTPCPIWASQRQAELDGCSCPLSYLCSPLPTIWAPLQLLLTSAFKISSDIVPG